MNLKAYRGEKFIPLPDKWRNWPTQLILFSPLENGKKRQKEERTLPNPESKVNWLTTTQDSNCPMPFLSFPKLRPINEYSQHCCLILICSSEQCSRFPSEPSLRSPYQLPPHPKWECRSTNMLQCFAVYNKQHRAHLISNNPLLPLCVI